MTVKEQAFQKFCYDRYIESKEPLTEIELRAYQMAQSGSDAFMIADKLSVLVTTIERHLRVIKMKGWM